MAGAKLTSPGRPASYWRTECHAKIFRDAYYDFMAFFKKITGIDWDNRLDNIPYDPNKFKYMPPVLGRPVGSLPHEKRHLLEERNAAAEKAAEEAEKAVTPESESEDEEIRQIEVISIPSSEKPSGLEMELS
jgi:hypothetical protein